MTGLASQGRSDPATGITTSIPGPYAVVDGTVDGTVISFALKYNGGDRISTFRGARRGNQIDFTHSVQVVHGPPGLNGIVGAAGATTVYSDARNASRLRARCRTGDVGPRQCADRSAGRRASAGRTGRHLAGRGGTEWAVDVRVQRRGRRRDGHHPGERSLKRRGDDRRWHGRHGVDRVYGAEPRRRAHHRVPWTHQRGPNHVHA